MDDSTVLAGGTRHWARVERSGKGLDSLEVEMTSYVLLALLSGPDMPEFGLDYSSGIVRWLAQQQNPFGGFASTQVGQTSDAGGLWEAFDPQLNGF